MRSQPTSHAPTKGTRTNCWLEDGWPATWICALAKRGQREGRSGQWQRLGGRVRSQEPAILLQSQPHRFTCPQALMGLLHHPEPSWQEQTWTRHSGWGHLPGGLWEIPRSHRPSLYWAPQARRSPCFFCLGHSFPTRPSACLLSAGFPCPLRPTQCHLLPWLQRQVIIPAAI